MKLHPVLAFTSVIFVGCASTTPAEPPPAMAPTNTSAAAPATTATADVLDTAASAGSFKTLLAAIKAADLESTLHGKGPFTVFAPTDEAFAALPAGTVESLLKPENKAKLQAILTYHVVPGRVTSSEVVKLSSAKTVQGQELKIATSGGGVSVDNAKVVKADVAASNGVIHVIDHVMLPK